MNNKKILLIIPVILVLFIGLIVIKKTFGKDNVKMYNVEMSIKNYGVITLELDRTAAPITVDNFVELVNQGFYNGLTFHRIIEGFMIQGGDPNGNGTGGSSKKIKGEFASNGYNNPIQHTRGVISMARSGDPNSASSQFFIMHQDYPSLNGNYAAFGHVTSGMEVVDHIVSDAQPIDRNGTIPRDQQPVIEYIKIV
jgi:peptidyl-prolyl cis-trans isomerase B (cyclophilin B)